jgi:hypothetical protein
MALYHLIVMFHHNKKNSIFLLHSIYRNSNNNIVDFLIRILRFKFKLNITAILIFALPSLKLQKHQWGWLGVSFESRATIRRSDIFSFIRQARQKAIQPKNAGREALLAWIAAAVNRNNVRQVFAP